MDIISIAKLNELHPKIRQSALDAYNEAVTATPANVHPVIDQTYRSFEESDKLYQQGRTTPGSIVSNAKAGQSYHSYGLALDFHLIVDGKDTWDIGPHWMIVVNIFKKHGFSWGGEFKTIQDYPHLENRLGHNWRDLMAMHEAKNFIPGTTFVKI
jgi:peptidoglycan L-alanyl-D-glutamate endopeptidase CwlK